MYQYHDAETYLVSNSKYRGGSAWTGVTNLHRRLKGCQFRTPKWRDGDIIKLRIDCTGSKDWILKYFYNDAEVGEFNIEPNLTYYVSVCAQNDQQYEAIY